MTLITHSERDHCGAGQVAPRLISARLACPVLLLGEHDEAKRESTMLMSDVCIEFPIQTASLGVEHVSVP